MSQDTLHREIIARSQADDWESAKREWALHDIWMSEEPDVCLCGHSPIREICAIKNRLNATQVEVGNCCVNHFLGLESNKLFTSLRKVVSDAEASFNADAIYLAHERGIINDWERDFYLRIWRKRVLSPKQLAKKRQINQKLLARFVK